MARSGAIALTAAVLAAFMLPARAQVRQVWERHYPWPPGLSSYGKDIVVDATDDVVVVGNCNYFADALTIRYASDGTELWVRPYDGPDSLDDAAAAVALDASGNAFVAGASKGVGTGWDFLTLAYDAAGNLLWARRYEGPAGGDDQAHDVAVDGFGRVFVVGTSAGSGTGDDAVILAYDAAGTLLWERRYDGPAGGDDAGHVVELAAGGGPVLVGFATVAGPGADYLTLAFDSAGNQLWSRTYDGPDGLDDRATGLVVDGAGNLLVTGGSEVISPAPKTYETATLKYDVAGTEQWARREGPVTDRFDYRSVDVDGAGNVYVAGAGWTSHVTVKLDPAGALLWKRSPALASAVAWELAVDAAGHAYVAGSFSNNLPGGDDFDWLTLAYDPAGNQLWMASYDAPPDHTWDFGVAIALDSAGRVLVAGTSEQTWPIPACTTVQYEATCAASIDVYCTAKVSSIGCAPSISLTNAPSSTKGWGSTLRVQQLVPKQVGLFFHGSSGPLAKPFHGGLLCAGPALRRHSPQPTYGTVGFCDGSMTEDLNAYIASGVDPLLFPGATIYVQAWTRDPGDPFRDSLSDAVAASICP